MPGTEVKGTSWGFALQPGRGSLARRGSETRETLRTSFYLVGRNSVAH